MYQKLTVTGTFSAAPGTSMPQRVDLSYDKIVDNAVNKVAGTDST